MFHVLAYQSTPGAISQTNLDTPGVTDVFAALQNSHYILPKPMRYYGGYAQGANVTNGRINTPSLRTISLPSIQPINKTAAPVSFFPLTWFGVNGPLIPAADEIAFEQTTDAGAVARGLGVLFFGEDRFAIPGGQVITVLATSTVVGVANSWTAGPIVFNQGLPAGRYAVVGMQCFGTNLDVARLVFPTQGPKPGCIGGATVAIAPEPQFRFGRLGVWGEFENTAPPTLEVFCSGAGAAPTLFLDLIKIR